MDKLYKAQGREEFRSPAVKILAKYKQAYEKARKASVAEVEERKAAGHFGTKWPYVPPTRPETPYCPGITR